MVVQGDLRRHQEHEIEYGIHVLRYTPPPLGRLSPRRYAIHQTLSRQVVQRYVREPVHFVHGHALLTYAGILDLYDGIAQTAYAVHSPMKLEMLASGRRRSAGERFLLWMTSQLLNRIERRCLMRTGQIHAYSAYTQRLLIELHGRELGSRVMVLPGWVDSTRFTIADKRTELKASLGWPIDRPVFFVLRRLVPRMGIDILLDALARLKNEGDRFHCVIGGSGPLAGELQATAHHLGLKTYIEWAGRVPDEVLPKMYAAADAFVLPTAELECFGLIALEAMACGRPTLAMPVGAIPEVVASIEPNWIATSPDVDGLKHLLKKYLSSQLPLMDPERLRSLIVDNYDAKIIIPRHTGSLMSL